MQAQTLYAYKCTQTILLHSYISVSKLWVNELGHCMPNKIKKNLSTGKSK